MATIIRLPGTCQGFVSRPTTSKNIMGLQTLRLGGYHLRSKSLQSSSFVKPNRGVFVCLSGTEPGVPLPSGPPDSNPIKGWLMGILISVVIPFFRHTFGSFMQIRSAIDKVEEIVDGVEKVAEVVEKVAEEIGDNLPAGKFKDAVELVEHVADQADKDAEALGEFIDKVEEVGEKLEDGVESLVELVHHQHDKHKDEKPPKQETL